MKHVKQTAVGLLMVLAAATSASAEPGPASTRVTRPLCISAAANAVMPSVGVDVSYQANARVAFGAQLTTLLIAHIDLSARSRFFLLAGNTWGLYAGANLHAWHSPLLLKVSTVVVTAELGYEWRRDDGFTLGVGVGGGLARAPDQHLRVDPTTARWNPLPLLNLRVGRSW